MPYKVLAFVGSLRKASINRVLFNAAMELTPPGLAITEFTRLGELTHYNADLDGETKPEPETSLLDAMRAADAFLFVSPEYNYSVPGVLKNAIDWGSRGGPKSPMRGKPAAIMGGSPGFIGTTRMQYHLRQILLFTDSPVLTQPEVAVPKLPERITDGRLTDETTRELVKKQLGAFETWIAKFVAA